MSTHPTFEEMMTSVARHGGINAELLHRDGFILEPLGDDGDIAMTRGWVDKETFGRQLLALELTEDVDAQTEIDWTWAVDFEYDGEWGYQRCEEAESGAFKVTWW